MVLPAPGINYHKWTTSRRGAHRNCEVCKISYFQIFEDKLRENFPDRNKAKELTELDPCLTDDEIEIKKIIE